MIDISKLKQGTFKVIEGETPHGGTYSVGFFLREDDTYCTEEEADKIFHVEYNEKDESIFSIMLTTE